MKSRVEISKRLVAINSFGTVFQSVLNLFVIVWLQQYLLRRIEPEEYKLYPLVVGVVSLVPILTQMLTSGLARFVTEAYARGDRERITQVVSTMFPICFGSGILVLVLAVPACWYIDRILTIDPERASDARWMLGLTLFVIAQRVAFAPFKSGMLVRQKFLWVQGIGLTMEIVRVGTLFALLFGVSTRVLWVVAATVPAAIYETIISVILSKRLVPELRFRASWFRRDLVRPIVSLGGWGVVIYLATTIRHMTTIVLLNEMATPVDVAIYNLGSMVDMRLRQMVAQPMITTGPVMTAMHATGQGGRLRRNYFRFSRYCLWPLMIVAIPFVVFREQLWSLYLGPVFAQYSSVTLVMALLFGRLLFMFPAASLAKVCAARGDNRPLGISAMLVEGTTLVVVVASLLLFEPHAIGPAAAVGGVAAIGYPLMHWRVGLMMTDGRFSQWWREVLVPGFLPALAATPVWFGIHWLCQPASWLELGLAAVPGCAVFVVVLLRYSLQPVEQDDLRSALSRVTARLRRGST